MLEQVRFSFTIELLSETHIGDGEMLPLADLRGLRPKGSEKELVATIQRDVAQRPVIESSSLRGALKAHMTKMGYAAQAGQLFGLDEIGKAGFGDHRLRLHAGEFLEGPSEGKWPLFRPSGDGGFRGTFLATGIALDRDRGTAKDKLLFRHEMLPPGSEFRVTGTFIGGQVTYRELMEPLFSSICEETGFSIGAGSGYGWGRARLKPDSVCADLFYYDVGTRSVGSLPLPWEQPNPLAASSDTLFRLELHCEGPFFIRDPQECESETKDKCPDMTALMGADDIPTLTGKAIVQALRQRSEWLEANTSPVNNDIQFRPGDQSDKLSRSQRLFGVAGWAKRVQIEHVDVQWPKRYHHRAQGIKLDAYTQAPIDGALIEYEVPAKVSVRVKLRIHDHGLVEGDIQHFERVMDYLRQPESRLRLGHSTSTGFGAFEVLHAGRGA